MSHCKLMGKDSVLMGKKLFVLLMGKGRYESL